MLAIKSRAKFEQVASKIRSFREQIASTANVHMILSPTVHCTISHVHSIFSISFSMSFG